MNRLLTPYAVPSERRPSRARFVPKIRAAVDEWRAAGYPGVTGTTSKLLNYWFEADHKREEGKGAQEFGYYFCQREAIETLIYLYEVRQLRSLFGLAKTFPSDQGRPLMDPNDDAFARYVFKMATGSGKTIVMALAIVWSYLNAVHDPGSDLARTFLLIAPNVIVYERLKSDFEDGRIFREYPMVPPEFTADWQFSVVLRDNPSQPSTRGALYLTNVHRLYDAPVDRAAGEPPAMTAVLGPRVRPDAPLTGAALRDLVAKHDRLMVLNDEGHHLHNDDLEWAKVIRGLHETLAERGGGVLAQLDFTATPKHQNSALFHEIVVDYPIAQAVSDGIVKRPILGELSETMEQESDDASVRYRDRLTAGITKWREMWKAFEQTGKKPVLFIMAENTKAADRIADWLEEQQDFAGHVLTIHTNAKGEVVEVASNKKDIEALREAARRVDSDDNPYRAIVSVLMLREGWDVKNVVVIVPLRPYTAKANILPEQTLGRGLRRMNLPASGHDEQVIVIEHTAFRQFWQRELEEEGLDIEWVPVDDLKPNFHAIYVDHSKLEYDVEAPILTPSLTMAIVLDGMTLDEVESRPLNNPPHPRMLKEDSIIYRGIEMVTLEVVEQHEIERDYPADPNGYVTAMCHLIERECRLTGQFHILAGLVKEYIEHRLFGGYYSMDENYVLILLNKSDAKTDIFNAFVSAIRKRGIKRRQVAPTGEALRVSKTNGFEWTEAGNRRVYRGEKTVFNLVACDNAYEAEFAQFLDSAADVAAYAKNTMHVHFTLEYQSSQGALRLYYPDFTVRLFNGDHYLVETKGLEDIEVVRKDARARQWCSDATMLTGVRWRYLKAPQAIFNRSTAQSFADFADEVAASSE